MAKGGLQIDFWEGCGSGAIGNDFLEKSDELNDISENGSDVT